MAVNLNPGADQTLVAAAYRASMANVPHDLSGTFEKVAQSYAESMSTIGQAWKQVATIGGKALGRATNNFIQSEKKKALASTYENAEGIKFFMDGTDNIVETENPDFDPNLPESESNKKMIKTITHVDGLNDIQDAYWETFQKNPFSRENIAKRMRLKQDKEKLFAQVDLLEAGFSEVAANFQAGNYSKDAMAFGGTAKLYEAISAMKTSSGKTEDGYYIKPSHDANGDIVLNLFDANDNPVLADKNDPKSRQISIKADNLASKTIINNPDVAKGLGDIFENTRKLSASNLKGVTWEHNAKVIENQLANLVDSENDLHYAMHEKRIGNLTGSFADELTSESEMSASIFGSMSQLKLQEIGVDEMADGTAGYSASDFTSGAVGTENYAKVVSALTNRENKNYDENVTREAFLDWAVGKAKGYWDYGKGQIKQGGKEGSDDGGRGRGVTFPPASGETYMVSKDDGGTKISNSQINAVMKAIALQQPIPADIGGNYIFDKSKGTYVHRMKGEEDVVVPNLDSLLANIYGENYSKSAALQWTQYIQDWDGSEFVTTSQKAKGGKTGIKINVGKPGEVKVGGGSKDLDSMLGGNYYDNQKWIDDFKDLETYDDEYIAPAFNQKSDFFDFEKTRGTRWRPTNTIRVTWKPKTGMGDGYKDFYVKPDDGTSIDFVNNVVDYMNEQMKKYGEKVLENISKKQKEAGTFIYDEDKY